MVITNCHNSHYQRVLSGVPQTSLALLVVIYTNYIDSGRNSQLLNFADDTKMYGMAYMEKM